MSETIIKIEHVTKEYRLGAIGGTTLRDDLQRLGAKLRHKEDPTKRIGAYSGKTGEKKGSLLQERSKSLNSRFKSRMG